MFSLVLKRALTAGVAVGVLLGAYTFVVIEPVVGEAVALEQVLAAEHAGTAPGAAALGDNGEPMFSRSEQTAGGVAASVLFALIVSAVFGVVFAQLRHRLPGRTDLTRSLWLAAVGFCVFALMPAIKYPANPPAVGDPDTVNERTLLYLACIAASVAAAVALTRFAGYVRARTDQATHVAVVATATVAVYASILVLLPGTPDRIAQEVPAALVWDFRLRSIGALALLWAALGLALGWLLSRDARAADGRAEPSLVHA